MNHEELRAQYLVVRAHPVVIEANGGSFRSSGIRQNSLFHPDRDTADTADTALGTADTADTALGGGDS